MKQVKIRNKEIEKKMKQHKEKSGCGYEKQVELALTEWFERRKIIKHEVQ